MRELLVYVADKSMGEAVGGFLDRDQIHRIIGCGSFEFDSRQDVKVASGQFDPGVYKRGNELIRPYFNEYKHAVLIADEEWKGSPGADKMRVRLGEHLLDAGWSAEYCLPLVVCPEADVWLWSSSPHTATTLGWPSWDALRPALLAEGLLLEDQAKPSRPKETAAWALKHSGKRIPWSSALFRKISSKASVKRCEDPALLSLLEQLRLWFPLEAQ